MPAEVYRYGFDRRTSKEDVESALLLAVWGCESLHGESQIQRDAVCNLDTENLACVIDARTAVGRDLNRLFIGFIRRDVGADAITIDRVAKKAAARIFTPADESTTGTEFKKRTCLKCNKLFDSMGPGNRICPRCKRVNDRVVITEQQLQKQASEASQRRTNGTSHG